MKADIAKKWVEALRSGEYKQTKHRLRRDDGFCCLGVLCDLVKDEVKGTWVKAPASLANQGPQDYSFDAPGMMFSKLSTVPNTVLSLVQLDDNWGAFTKEDGTETSLAKMNDNGATFEEIADTIEKYAEVL